MFRVRNTLSVWKMHRQVAEHNTSDPFQNRTSAQDITKICSEVIFFHIKVLNLNLAEVLNYSEFLSLLGVLEMLFMEARRQLMFHLGNRNALEASLYLYKHHYRNLDASRQKTLQKISPF